MRLQRFPSIFTQPLIGLRRHFDNGINTPLFVQDSYVEAQFLALVMPMSADFVHPWSIQTILLQCI